MRELLLTTAQVGDLARQQKVVIYQWFATPECQPWLPAKSGVGESRAWAPKQVVLAMIHSDLTRWGLSVPFAGRTTNRIAEALTTDPSADEVTIEFRANGASTVSTGGEPSDAAKAAGDVRFRVVIELRQYWAAVWRALDLPPAVGAVDHAQ